ncbi:uridine phosphorylase [candidate division CSSED10-310 bacterium]|uniref:Uridine phosphorylase n=1 Tax=candidate division CSSED10-310 bacterium TaxID=2855610 RepID=A0ABV6YZN6_UNCC1
MHSSKEYHIALSNEDVGRYVILPGDPARAEHIAGFFDEATEMAFNREYRTFTGTIDGIRVSTTSTGIGCPSAAICVEELIRCGADTFIRVGTAGGLQPEIELGDVVITTATVRDEGTSRQYVPLEYPAVAHFDVTTALKQAAQKLKFRYHMGIGHTKDAFFTEDVKEVPLQEYTQQRWKVWERAQVLSTSMEAAAIFVISAIKKVRAGEILAIIGLTYKHDPVIKKVGVDEAIKIALEAVKILAAQDQDEKYKK